LALNVCVRLILKKVATSSKPDLLTPSEVHIRLAAATYNHFDMDNYSFFSNKSNVFRFRMWLHSI